MKLAQFQAIQPPKRISLELTFLESSEPVVLRLNSVALPAYKAALKKSLSESSELDRELEREWLVKSGAKKLPARLRPRARELFQDFATRPSIESTLLLIQDVEGLTDDETGEPVAYSEELGRFLLANETPVGSDQVRAQLLPYAEVEREIAGPGAAADGEEVELIYPRMLAGALIERAIKAAASQLRAYEVEEEREIAARLGPTSAGTTSDSSRPARDGKKTR